MKIATIPFQKKVRQELADIFAYAFLLADKYDFDVKEVALEEAWALCAGLKKPTATNAGCR